MIAHPCNNLQIIHEGPELVHLGEAYRWGIFIPSAVSTIFIALMPRSLRRQETVSMSNPPRKIWIESWSAPCHVEA